MENVLPDSVAAVRPKKQSRGEQWEESLWLARVKTT